VIKFLGEIMRFKSRCVFGNFILHARTAMTEYLIYPSY